VIGDVMLSWSDLSWKSDNGSGGDPHGPMQCGGAPLAGTAGAGPRGERRMLAVASALEGLLRAEAVQQAPARHPEQHDKWPKRRSSTSLARHVAKWGLCAVVLPYRL
jgi:hypothetical protein